MRHPHSLLRLIPLLLAGAALAACDQRTPDLPTGARAEAGQAGLAPLLSAGADAVPGRYIVVLHQGQQQASAAAVAREVAAEHGARVHHTYTAVLNGFAATLPAEAVEALRRNPQVKYVAEDVMTYPAQVTQPSATWGLDRVDQRDLPLNTTYVYSATGSGVRVYVIDSGIRTAHNEFGGRASVGTDFVGDGQNGQDCNGHGTHVSGTIGGATYGVAKSVQLISVRVFPCSGGTLTSTVIAAVDWVRLNAIKPAVVNYSGGGGFNAAHNQAVQALIATGITYVTAAGNSAADACNYSPASTPEALTVGSSQSNDARSFSSNWGSCVDLFAPGNLITSAWYTSDAATATISGTSMASPHVAGVAALYLQGNPTANAATVGAQILATSTVAKLTDIGVGSPNRLLFSRLTLPPPGAVIGLNPGLLNFTFVRTVGGPASEAQAVTDAPPQAFTASGEGSPKEEPAATGTIDVATVHSPVMTAGTVLGNTGTTTLNWTASSNRPWLTADPTEGSVNASYNARVNATVNAAGLAAGVHAGAVSFTGAINSPAGLNVTVNVTDALALLVGTPRTGLAGASGSQSYYAVQVPAGAATLTIATAGGTGDADLYVRYGDVPSQSLYNCRPYLSGNVESCQVTNPLPGTYYVMLRGFGSYSGVTLSATAGGVPAAPLNLGGRPASSTSIRVTWTDASVNEANFVLNRRAQSSTGAWGAWASAGAPPANANSYNSAGLTAGTVYQYRLRSCNAAGCSAWVVGTPLSIPTAAPAPPFNLLATPTAATAAGLVWTDGSSDETGFTLQRALRNLDGTWGAYAVVASPGPNVTSFSSTGLLPGRQYRYQLRACNPAGCSAWATSNVVVMPTLPAAPPAISGTPLSASSIRVQWTDGSPNESSFRLERARVNGAGVVGTFGLVATLAPNQVLFNNTGLAAGIYRYRIRACNLAGCSAWTTSANVTIS